MELWKDGHFAYVTAKSNGLSKDKDDLIYGLSNLNTYCTKKKETGSYFENKYYGH